MHLSRTRVLVGLLVVAAGAVWAAGGPSALRALGLVGLRALPSVIIAAGAVLLIRAAVPRGLIAGPIVLLVLGLAALAVQLGVVRAIPFGDLLAPVSIIAGILIALSGRASALVPERIVERCQSLFVPRRCRLSGTAPSKLILRCALGGIEASLESCTYPGGIPAMVVDVTLVAGHVELAIPHDWHLRAGRVDLARGIRFNGDLDSPDPPPVDPRTIDRLIVLNVQGLGGVLTVTRPRGSEGEPRPEPPAISEPGSRPAEEAVSSDARSVAPRRRRATPDAGTSHRAST
jgi:hypothetical protein